MEVGSPGNKTPCMTFEPTRVMTSSEPHNPLITKGKAPKRSQALDHLRTLPACDTLQSLVDLAFQGVDLTRFVFPPQLLSSMREFFRYMGWEIPSVDSDWVKGRSPAFLLFWRTLVPLVRRLSWRQEAAFAEWVPEAGTVTADASQGVTVNTVSARAEQGAGASTVAASTEQGLERIDPVPRDLDEYPSSAVTITDEEQMDQGEESLSVDGVSQSC
ncbi:hypothetical protein PoB_002484200 [Plakobranchus ocellatus]|uniref:Uncharacterized protein n=1 Tax=Plakobranchus ocellatus TaxID=259542 RepID=A0AAV3ZUH4_9GAST|nr:hypothetical protein PoB_002484200 [Plakobranchus ocellatus]